MNREEFCKSYWEYYLVLEKDLLEVEKYVSFELGDNYKYDNEPTDLGNSLVFSNEFVKQYQAICSEIDVILKSICEEIAGVNVENMRSGYTPNILQHWSHIIQQKVDMHGIELQPFIGWSQDPNYQAPHWWKPYNKVKHERISHVRDANLKNVINALAGLYVLENYFVKYIGDRDSQKDVPNDISKLFEMVDYVTKDTVIGRNQYVITNEDIDKMFENLDFS